MQAFNQTNSELDRITEIILALSDEINHIEELENQDISLTMGKLVKQTARRYYYQFRIEPKIIIKGSRDNCIIVDGQSHECTWRRGTATVKVIESNEVEYRENRETEDSFPEDDQDDSSIITVIITGAPLPECLEQATLKIEHAKLLKTIRNCYDNIYSESSNRKSDKNKIPVLNMAEQLFNGVSVPLLSPSAQTQMSAPNNNNHHSNIGESLANSTLTKDDSKIASHFAALNQYQKDAVQMAMHRSLSLIWGPPGTGKTHALAMLAIKHLQAGRKVLLVSNSNAAVDVAMQAICERLVDTSYYDDYRLLRMRANGRALEQQYPKVARVNHFCRDNNASSQQNSGDKKNRKARLTYAEVLENARLIAITCYSGTTNESIQKWGYDVVIVDEASTASLPHLYAIARHAKLAITLVGDFIQLPPIGKGKSPITIKWLQRSIFDQLHLSTVKEALTCKYLAPLRTQYRMHPQIATIANQVFYQGMLLNDESTEHLIYSHQSPLFDANSVTLIDTTTILNEQDYKAIPRFNRYNSTLSLQILNNLLEQGLTETLTIGYTSPFKRQTQLVRRQWKELLTEQCHAAKRDKQKLTIDTIHSFQGNQVDLLLLDLTECATTPDISFNDPTKHGWRPDLLINVAITRTRQKLIIIGNLPYFRSRYPHDSFIRRVLRSASSTGSTIHAIDLKQLMTR